MLLSSRFHVFMSRGQAKIDSIFQTVSVKNKQ